MVSVSPLSVTKVQIVGDLTKDRANAKGFKRSQKEWEVSIAEHVGKFFDKMTMEDIVKLAMFGSTTVVLKELGLLRWQPLWAEPTDRQEALNWLTNAMAAYLLVYKTEAVGSFFTGICRSMGFWLG